MSDELNVIRYWSAEIISKWDIFSWYTDGILNKSKNAVEFLIGAEYPTEKLRPIFIERKLAHEMGYPHAAVHLWLLDESNRVLLQKRSENKDSNPGYWDIAVAGHVGLLAQSEDELKAAIDKLWDINSPAIKRKAVIREAFEELWIARNDLYKLRKIGDFTVADKTLQNKKDFLNAQTNRVYVARLKKPVDTLNLQTDEVAGIKSFSITEFEQIILDHFNNIDSEAKIVYRHPEYYMQVTREIRKLLWLNINIVFEDNLRKFVDCSLETFTPITLLTSSANSSETNS